MLLLNTLMLLLTKTLCFVINILTQTVPHTHALLIDTLYNHCIAEKLSLSLFHTFIANSTCSTMHALYSRLSLIRSPLGPCSLAGIAIEVAAFQKIAAAKKPTLPRI